MGIRVKEIEAKSMIVASNLPDTDYVVNPYTGCEFGCHYCYASFMGRFVEEPIEAWGQYLYVKTNAVEVVRAELEKFSDEKKKSTIFLSSVTDPYQGAEARYQLTRGILQAFVDVDYWGPISILTKSGMVKRDIDILKRIKNIEVGLTVTSTDDDVTRLMEVKAPIAEVRLKTLAFLVENNIPVYAFVGPLFPHFRYKKDELENLFKELHAAGVRDIYAEHINCKPYILERLRPVLESQPSDVQSVYQSATSAEHRRVLGEMVLDFVARYGMNLRLGQVIYHGGMK